jgi:hypothetical protein
VVANSTALAKSMAELRRLAAEARMTEANDREDDGTSSY